MEGILAFIIKSCIVICAIALLTDDRITCKSAKKITFDNITIEEAFAKVLSLLQTKGSKNNSKEASKFRYTIVYFLGIVLVLVDTFCLRNISLSISDFVSLVALGYAVYAKKVCNIKVKEARNIYILPPLR